MKQQDIILADESRPAGAEDAFFETETIQRAQPVMPLDETPTQLAPRRRYLRVPMRSANHNFSRFSTIIALLAVTALGVIAGTLLYQASLHRTADENSGGAFTRTVTPQYQFVIGKPESQKSEELPKNILRDDSTPLSSETKSAPESKINPAPETDQKQEILIDEEIPEVKEADTPEAKDRKQERDEKRERKEDKELEKLLRKNKIGEPKDKQANDNPNETGAANQPAENPRQDF